MDASRLGDHTDGLPVRLQTNRLTSCVRDLSTMTLPDGAVSEVYLDDPGPPLPGKAASLEQRLGAIDTAANAQVAENHLRRTRVGVHRGSVSSTLNGQAEGGYIMAFDAGHVIPERWAVLQRDEIFNRGEVPPVILFP